MVFTFNVLAIRSPLNESRIYLSKKNCSSKHSEQLTENNTSLDSMGIKYLLIKSLILTNDISIIEQTTRAIMIKNNCLCSTNFYRFLCIIELYFSLKLVRHNLLVFEILQPVSI